ncbi:Serine/threonine-protein kinase OXI1 [Euphorbia peplus]|nr:Serine/threonine-protein kinase OXI1 [Euphorbia peplus]
MNLNNLESSNVPTLNLDDLKIISPVGRGAKGLVFVIKEAQNSQVWALKVILRDLIEKRHENVSDDQAIIINEYNYKRVWFEQQVLSRFDHPLLPRLRGVLSTDKVLGYAIDFCPGGHLHKLRKQQSEKMFAVDIIRFYAAELVLVLEYLHNLGVVYRDLKPENILIQENGHIMLVDFDLSTEISSTSNRQISPPANTTTTKPHSKRYFLNCFSNAGITPADSYSYSSKHNTTGTIDTSLKSKSFVGTEEYVPPEMIQGHGHDFAVDMWSLGVVLYEMLYGKTPFKGSNRKETFFRILSTAPDLVGEATPLRDIIRKLLVKDPKERMKLGEMKRHEFFRGIDWNMVVEMSRPPYIPPPRGEFVVDDGIKTDLETFVRRIFRGDDGDDDESNKNQQLWVQGVDNSTQNNSNFLVF